MPLTANEAFRDFVRWDAAHPLPIGDPSSGVHNPTKRDFREVIQGAFDAAAAAAGYAASATGTPLFTTRVSAQSATIPAWANQIMVDGQVFQRDAGGVALTTAGGAKWSPVGPRATLRAYGAAGNGTTNDHAAMTAAINDARARGIVLDGEGLTYRIGSQLTAIAGQVENLTIDASGLTADLAWDMVGPAYEASKPLTANALQGARQLNVTAHGYSVGDIILAQSDMILETGTNSVCAHWAEVVAVTANTITLSHALLCNLLTANNARVQRLPRSEGTRLRGVTIIGSATCPGGIQMARLTRPVVESLWTRNCEIRGLSLNQCYQPRTTFVSGEKSDRAGLGYAMNVSGCGWADIGETRGRRCRHVIAWGAAATDIAGGTGAKIPCVGGSFGSVIGSECMGSVFDTHPGAIAIWQRGGMVIGDMSAEYSAQDAITMQAAGGSIKAKITGQVSRHVCLIQPFHSAAAFQTFPSVEADVEGDTSTGQGVSVDIQGTGGLRSVRLAIYGSHSAESVSIKVANGAALGAVAVAGNATSGARAILVNQLASGQIGTLSLAGRFRTTEGAVVASQIIGPTDTGTPRTNISVTGLDVGGGTYGLRADNRVDVKGAAVAFLAGSTAATFTSGGATVT